MIRSIILCALLVGAANAARQIVIGASPPPPASTGIAPGAVLGTFVPGYSASTFGTPEKAKLCEGMKNLTSGYPKEFITCDWNYVSDVDNGQSGVQAVSVNGFVVFNDYVGGTAASRAQATSSRNAFVNNVLLNNTISTAVFPGANTNNTCTSQFDTGLAGTSLASADQAVNGANPQARCRIASKGYTTADATGDIRFNSGGNTAVPATTVDTVGIDNGKSCPYGPQFLTAATTAAVNPLSTASAANAQGGLVCQAAANKQTFTCYVMQSWAANNGGNVAISTGLFPTPLANVVAGTYLTVSGSAVAAPQTFANSGANAWSGGTLAGQITKTGDAKAGTCAAADLTALVTALNGNTFAVTGPTSATAGGATASLTFDVVLPAATACTSGDTMFYAGATAGATNAGIINLTAAWSPFCDTDFNFYQNNRINTANGGTTAPGATLRACPSCANAAGSTLMTYNSGNQGKFCTSTTGTDMLTDVVRTAAAAGLAGASCIGPIGSTDGGVGAPQDTGKAQVAGNVVTSPLTIGNVFPLQSAALPTGQFTTANQPIANSGTTFRHVAVDTEYLSPCSFPRIVQTYGTTAVNTVGNYRLLSAQSAAGTCNTYSLFWNGGNAANGIGVFPVQNALALNAEFSAAIVGPTPAPAPVTPAPAPVTPGPVKPPTPTPPKPIVCTYRGSYEIAPLYGPCDKYHLASGTADDCSYNLVTLRTKSQLGKKMARIRWGFATVAEAGLSTPTNVVAEARISAKGTCTNRFLAAPSDPKTLKVGGSSWKWQFVPYPDSDKCDHVNMISQNRLATTAFLEVPRTCDRFRWNATDGGRQRFRLKKIQ